MPSKRHVTIWCTLARSLGVNQKTLSNVNQVTEVDFFYKTLPSLGKDLDRGLCGQFVLTSPFKRQARSALPQFLYELFILVFNKDGSIRENTRKIQELRQLLMLFYKFETPFSANDIAEGERKFVENDARVMTSDFPFGITEVRKHMLSLLPDDPMDIRCHHSNGATADRVSGYDKRVKRRYIPSLMKTYNVPYFFNTLDHSLDWSSRYETLTTEPTARLSFVPKDSRGPRAICMEPHERMYVQKGLQTLLYDHIERYSPAKGYINFTDQGVNQRLAYEASISGAYATIDLKDASDLVSWNLLRLLVSPVWFRALQSTRSPIVTLPSLSTIQINKFASMGSALCFPLEAMLFWSIAKTVCPEVYVYGDDIIVPNEFATDVITALTAYGLAINFDKTLTTGLFRESCGAEYYDGYDITYAKCKSFDAIEFIAFCNNVTRKFGTTVSDPLIKVFEFDNGPVYRSPIAELIYEDALVFYTDTALVNNDVFFKRRWSTDLQSYQTRRLTYVARKKGTNHPSVNNDYDFFYDWLTERSSLMPTADKFWSKLTDDLPLQASYSITNCILCIPDIISADIDRGEVSLQYKYTWV